MRAPYLPCSMSPPAWDSTSCYLSAMGTEMLAAGRVCVEGVQGVQVELEMAALCTDLSVGSLALAWKNLSKFMLLLSDFTLEGTFLAPIANIMNTIVVLLLPSPGKLRS